MDIINIENRYFFFDVKAVEREQDIDDDPWWNVHVIYKTNAVNFEDFGESITENELLYTIECIENYLENCEIQNISYIEPDYKFELEEYLIKFIINIGYGDSINILLTKEELTKIKDIMFNVINKEVK